MTDEDLEGRLALFTAGRPTRFGRFATPDPAWLALAEPEEALRPDLEIVDAHHHLWDLPGFTYLLPDLVGDLECGHTIVATVFCECHAMYRARGPEAMRPVGEIEFAAGIAAMSASGGYGPTAVNRGIVGFADLTLGDAVAPVLEAEIAAGGGRLAGIRHGGAWDADPAIGNSPGMTAPGFYLAASCAEGLRRLASYGLAFDAWVFHSQLRDVRHLARAVPESSIVLGHLGGPLGYGAHADRRQEVFDDWRRGMAELAECPNVTVKIGGLLMRLAAFDYLVARRPPSSEELARVWGPYIRAAIDLFGPERCLTESNYPVEKMAVPYGIFWNAIKRTIDDLTEGEQRSVLSATADRVYRLDLDGLQPPGSAAAG